MLKVTYTKIQAHSSATALNKECDYHLLKIILRACFFVISLKRRYRYSIADRMFLWIFLYCLISVQIR